MNTGAIRPVDLTRLDETNFERQFAGCIVLNADGKILLQQRDAVGCRFPGYLATFGGEIEKGETPLVGLIRELKEELGADVISGDVVYLGAFTEDATRHSELIHGFFWHDRKGTITGCYEGQMRAYDTIAVVLHHPQIMADLPWLLAECEKRGLL